MNPARALVGIMLCGALLAGCTPSHQKPRVDTSSRSDSSSSTTASDAAFIKRANAVCAPYQTWIDRYPNGMLVAGFDPQAPDPADLVQAANWLDRVPLYQTFVPALTSLAPPQRQTSAWSHVVGQLVELQSDWATQTRAAHQADGVTWTHQFNVEGVLLTAIYQNLLALGFDMNDSCSMIFRD